MVNLLGDCSHRCADSVGRFNVGRVRVLNDPPTRRSRTRWAAGEMVVTGGSAAGREAMGKDMAEDSKAAVRGTGKVSEVVAETAAEMAAGTAAAGRRIRRASRRVPRRTRGSDL